MNPIWIAAIVDVLLLAAFIFSLVFNIRFVANRKTEFAQLGKIPANPLMLSDVLMLACAIVLSYSLGLPQIMPLLAVGGALLLYHLHGVNAFSYWQFDHREFWFYGKQGLRGYVTILLPLTVIALLVAGLCKLLGVQFTQPQVEVFLGLKGVRQILLFVFFAVIVAPIWEEVAFRGVLYPFLKKHLPMGWAMVLSSAVWAAIHLHWPVLLPFTFLGCALCFLYEKTGKLGCNIVLHAIFNLTSTLLLLFLKHYGNWQAY
ncbi:MAG: CPBP family intramembrane metalloprotease [Verrucomicrobiales bacterium]|nr:CPBP family intramembrane metalloprotease [Verrucomicrobiales bacterium]